jgi:hypothetical protein
MKSARSRSLLEPARRGTRFLLLSAWLACNCTVNDDIVARHLTNSGGGGAGGTQGAGGQNSQAGAGERCSEPTFVSTAMTSGDAEDRCAGWAARRSFSHALCICGNAGVTKVLATATSDSASSAGAPPRGSAAIGINGSFPTTAYLNVDGSVTIAGGVEISSSGGFDIAGDLRLAGPAATVGPIFVGRDAWLLAATSSLSLIEVGRDLYLGQGAMLTSFGPALVDGQRFEQSFAVAPPCDCADGELLDVPGIVQDGMLRNDDSRIGLTLDALDEPGAAVSLTLECGRFALQRIASASPIALRIEGQVALFVDGSVDLGPGFTLELGPGAELDWFVRGAISLAAGASIGRPGRPAAARLYTTEPGDLTLPGTNAVSLNLYAPRMNVTIGGLGDVYGALFAAGVSSMATVLVHYDRAVVSADAACTLPLTETCSRCDDCSSGSACVAGVCGACSTDADCCSPLACEAGQCKPLAAN